MVLDLGGCPGGAEIDLETASASRLDFLHLLAPKMTPKWTQKGTSLESKRHQKIMQKTTAKIAPKRSQKGAQMVPKWTPKLMQNRPMDLQGDLGDSSGSPGVPPGRRRRQNDSKIHKNT